MSRLLKIQIHGKLEISQKKTFFKRYLQLRKRLEKELVTACTKKII